MANEDAISTFIQFREQAAARISPPKKLPKLTLEEDEESKEKCSKCKRKGPSFKEQWIGCLGCSFWVCAECAFKDLPGYDLIPKKSQQSKSFYNAVLTNDTSPWQYVCPSCVTVITRNKVPSRTSSPVAPPVPKLDNNELRAEFENKISSLTTAVTDISSQIENLKSSIDKKVTTWSDVVKKSQISTSSLTNVIKNVAKETESNKVLIFSRISETGNIEKDKEMILNSISELEVNPRDHKFRDLVRLGRPNKDVKRLIKVTFDAEFSTRVIMAAYRYNVKYAKFGVRSDLPKESREILKTKANKVFSWNKELQKEAENRGDDINVSYSLRQNGSVWRFEKMKDGSWAKNNKWLFEENTDMSGAK